MFVGLWGCVVGVFFTLYGRRVRYLAFPLFVLLFMVPLPPFVNRMLTFELKMAATTLAAMMLRIFGISVLQEGNIIDLDVSKMQVVDACSGLRSLISLSALAAALAYLTQRRPAAGVLLFLSSVPVAIGANVLRLTVTAILASLYGEGVAQGFLHEFSGLLVFAFAIICLGCIGGFLRWLIPGKDTGSPSDC